MVTEVHLSRPREEIVPQKMKGDQDLIALSMLSQLTTQTTKVDVNDLSAATLMEDLLEVVAMLAALQIAKTEYSASQDTSMNEVNQKLVVMLQQSYKHVCEEIHKLDEEKAKAHTIEKILKIVAIIATVTGMLLALTDIVMLVVLSVLLILTVTDTLTKVAQELQQALAKHLSKGAAAALTALIMTVGTTLIGAGAAGLTAIIQELVSILSSSLATGVGEGAMAGAGAAADAGNTTVSTEIECSEASDTEQLKPIAKTDSDTPLETEQNDENLLNLTKDEFSWDRVQERLSEGLPGKTKARKALGLLAQGAVYSAHEYAEALFSLIDTLYAKTHHGKHISSEAEAIIEAVIAVAFIIGAAGFQMQMAKETSATTESALSKMLGKGRLTKLLRVNQSLNFLSNGTASILSLFQGLDYAAMGESDKKKGEALSSITILKATLDQSTSEAKGQRTHDRQELESMAEWSALLDTTLVPMEGVARVTA